MSTQGKWTPGPWRISAHLSEGVAALNGHFVADCRVYADAALIPENEANACLIAAAPELAEVADEAPILSKYHGPSGFEVERFIADYKAWNVKRRAALAKARGDKP